MREPVYLDHNASTPLLPEALDAMLPYLRGRFGNPSSQHAFGQEARKGVEHAREQVAKLIGAAPDEIIFTSGGTEANNLAVRGAAAAKPEKRHLVTCNVEHSAVGVVCSWLEEQGYTATRVAVETSGRVAAEKVLAAITDETLLVTVMHANNETGVLQPVGEIGPKAREKGVLVHTDAAQSAGKVKVHVDELGVDLMSLAAHKLYGPKGVGALFIRKGTKVSPFSLGGTHEKGLRPGTENVASIVGFGAACAAAMRDAEWLEELLAMMRIRLWERLKAEVPGIALNGDPEGRVPNTLNVRFPGVTGPALLAAAPDVAASTSAACRDGADVASGVILAMGVSHQEAMGSVRLSVGRANTDAEIDRAADALAKAWKSLRGIS